MNGRFLLLTVLSAAVVAWRGLGVPWPIVVAVVSSAVLLRHPVVVAVALVLVIGARSADQRAALDADLPARVTGTAELVSDPAPGRFGTSVELRVGGRRWQAQIPRADEWVVRPMLSGDLMVVDGRPARMRGAPEGWRVSRHLAGRLVVRDPVRGPPARIWFRAANWVHRTLAAGTASFDEDARALFLGLVVGDDRAQSDLEQHRFRATGLGHLLAVSGQNVVFVLLLVGPLLRRCNLFGRWFVGLAVLAAFVVLTRGEASVLRAAMMAGVGLTVGLTGRFASGSRVLAVALLALLVVDPLMVDGLGFQLSVCATFGMIVAAGPIAGALRGPPVLVEAAACTLAAQAATSPLLVGLNGGVPSVATIANVLAVPAAGLVMVLGLTVGLVAGTVAAPVAAVLNLPSRLLVGWILEVAATGSVLPLPLLGADRLVLVASAAAVLILRRGRGGSAVVTTLLVTVPVVVALWPVSPPRGSTDLGSGVVLSNRVCSGREVRVVELGAPADVVGTLGALQRSGVVRAQVVVGRAGEATTAIAEQLRARVLDPRSVTQGSAGDGGWCRVR